MLQACVKNSRWKWRKPIDTMFGTPMTQLLLDRTRQMNSEEPHQITW